MHCQDSWLVPGRLFWKLQDSVQISWFFDTLYTDHYHLIMMWMALSTDFIYLVNKRKLNYKRPRGKLKHCLIVVLNSTSTVQVIRILFLFACSGFTISCSVFWSIYSCTSTFWAGPYDFYCHPMTVFLKGVSKILRHWKLYLQFRSTWRNINELNWSH